MKVLVTSSTGLTGRAVVKALVAGGASVRAMIHSERHAEEMRTLGAEEVAVASIESEEDMARAMEEVDTVFYICPTAHPREGEIGKMAVDIAERLAIKRFIYQSVHKSIEPELIHHRQKLMVEQHLIESNLNYSILRPTAFMQNILNSAALLKEKHIFAQRFFTSAENANRMNLIDVDDYATVAAKVTLGSEYDYGSFDICGPQNLSARDMLNAMSQALDYPIILKYSTDEEFSAMARQHNMPEYKLEILLAMFRAYNRYGFNGNSFVTSAILGHQLKTFKSFIIDTLL